jgi:hypothetical protein
MSQDLFERAAQRFDPPVGAWEGLGRRRDRKRRNQRIASAVLALIIAVVAIGGLFSSFRRGVHHEPASPTITPSNVSDLKLVWSANLDSPASVVTNNYLHVAWPFPPTVSDGVVYVETDTTLYAFDATCSAGGATCEPLWVADTGTGFSSPPTVADGVVYVTRVGRLHAFAADCGTSGVTCTSSWTADTGRAYGSPVVADGIVYDYDAVDGTVYAFKVKCATGGATCKPLWTAPTTPTTRQPPLAVARVGYFLPAVSGGIVYAVAKADDRIDRLYAFDAGTGKRLWLAETPHPHGKSIDSGNTPVVAGGLVFVDFGDTLYGFLASCQTDGGMCDPAWTWSFPGSSPGSHAMSPVVAGGVVYLKSFSSETAGQMYAFPVNCGTGGVTCNPTWTAADDGWGGVVAGGDLVISTSNSAQVLDAYPASCATGGSTCEPAWRATTPTGAPSAVIANGVVFVGTDGGVSRIGGRLYAFPAFCGTNGGECQPAWTSSKSGGWMSPPAVDGSMLFTTTGDGKLYAFGLGGAQRGLSSSQRHDAATFYIVAAILVGALLLIRGRRRAITALGSDGKAR